jgi:hypothetical protein
VVLKKNKIIKQSPASILSPETIRFELHSLASGVYFLQLTLEGERIYFGRLMLK